MSFEEGIRGEEGVLRSPQTEKRGKNKPWKEKKRNVLLSSSKTKGRKKLPREGKKKGGEREKGEVLFLPISRKRKRRGKVLSGEKGGKG